MHKVRSFIKTEAEKKKRQKNTSLPKGTINLIGKTYSSKQEMISAIDIDVFLSLFFRFFLLISKLLHDVHFI